MTNTVEVVDQSTQVTTTPVVTTVVPTTLDVSVSTPDETVTLSLELLEATVIATSEPVTVAVDNQVTNILTVGTQGPQGPTGLVEDEIVYSKRVDFIGIVGTDEVLYRAEAAPGTTESQAFWRIRKILLAEADGDVTETWADGTAAFDKIWTNRATYTYL